MDEAPAEVVETSPTKQSATTKAPLPESAEKRRLTRVRSGHDLSALKVEQKGEKDLKVKEQEFKKEVGAQIGFDLKQISSHYEHRRKLRREKMVLRYGELVPLRAKHDKGWHERVLAFARFSLIETAIIAINMSEHELHFWID